MVDGEHWNCSRSSLSCTFSINWICFLLGCNYFWERESFVIYILQLVTGVHTGGLNGASCMFCGMARPTFDFTLHARPVIGIINQNPVLLMSLFDFLFFWLSIRRLKTPEGTWRLHIKRSPLVHASIFPFHHSDEPHQMFLIFSNLYSISPKKFPSIYVHVIYPTLILW